MAPKSRGVLFLNRLGVCMTVSIVASLVAVYWFFPNIPMEAKFGGFTLGIFLSFSFLTWLDRQVHPTFYAELKKDIQAAIG